ncbi:MAG: CvpA family protein [Acidimicrobiia bacterium]
MLDFLLGSFFVFLFIRGWARGFVKEAMDLLGVLVGLAVAFRLSPAAGAVVSGTIGSSPTVSRIIGGLLLFTLVGGAAAVVAHYLHRVARLPGLALGNRLTGAGLALAWGAFVATLALSVVSLFRLPPVVAEQLDESAVAATLTDPAGMPQSVFAQVSGDRVIGVLLSLDDLIGSRRAIVEGDDRVDFEAADPDSLSPDPGAALDLLESLNEEREEEGLEPLVYDDALSAVAAAHAGEMYTEGYFSHDSPATGTVSDRLDRSGVTVRRAGENLALAVDSSEAHEGLVASPSHHANIVDPGFTSVGLAAVKGPLGLMVVQVFGG